MGYCQTRGVGTRVIYLTGVYKYGEEAGWRRDT